MNIAFCKFAGLANGGIEKYLQTLAILYRTKHDVDYYYTNAAPIRGQVWQHPDNNQDRINLLEKYNINLIKAYVQYRFHNVWYNTNFMHLFYEQNYDYLITAGNGEREYPYTELKQIPIIHTVHGDHVFNQKNIKKYVLLCNWQADRWKNNGGDASRLVIIPPVVHIPETWDTNFRDKLNIPGDAFVYGLHQRGDSSISLTVSLEAFALLQNKNTYYIIMGGSHIHRNYIQTHNISNVIFIDECSDTNMIHSFLDSIDVYAHCRSDGEVCSASLIEAMSHGKPIVSYPGLNMGHAEQLADCGKIAYSINEYANEMKKLQNKDYYNEMSEKIKKKYSSTYDYKLIEKQLLEIL